MSEQSGQALVLGSSVAGLCAARVLADHFAKVVVLERDQAPEGDEARKGVPQGRHAHVLLKAGEAALAELFPGLIDELEARGSVVLDFGRDLRWFHHGVWKLRFDSDVAMHTQLRPMLEGRLRARIAALPNVEIRYGAAASGLVLENGRVAGARIGESVERADVIVDASGRGSQTHRWLAEAGFAEPEEEKVGVDLMYASRLFEMPAAAPDWKALLVYPEPPAQKRFAAIFQVEGNQWLTTLGGWAGDHPPLDDAGFLRFARDCALPDVAQALATARPLGEIAGYKFPHARRRRWEKARMPAGLLLLGDAVCSFDPVFGQGMTVSAQGALALAAHLEKDPRAERPNAFQKKLARLANVPWLLSTSEDFRYPEVDGARLPGLSLLQAYTRQVFQLCATSASVYSRFIPVLHLLAGPQALFAPTVIMQVLGKSLGFTGRAGAPVVAEGGAAPTA